MEKTEERTEKLRTWKILAISFAIFFLIVVFCAVILISKINPNINLQRLLGGSGVITIYVDSLPQGIDNSYENALREARAFWEKEAKVTFREVSSPQEAQVVVKWVKEFGGGTLGHAVNSNFIEIGLGDSYCLNTWRPYKYKSILAIAIHELGHALGADDNYTDQSKVMYYKTSMEYDGDIDTKDIIPDAYTRFYPICTDKEVAEYSFEVISDKPLDIYVVPSKTEYEKLAKFEQFQQYDSCKSLSASVYKKNCVIGNGSGIVLLNRNAGLSGGSADFTIKAKEV